MAHAHGPVRQAPLPADGASLLGTGVARPVPWLHGLIDGHGSAGSAPPNTAGDRPRRAAGRG